MPWHPDGRRREGGGSVLLRPRRSVSSRVLPGTPDQKQRQLWLGTKWESRVLTAARYGSSLLTCARGPPAETRKCPGGGDRDAWLGVKGSPVQIRPSRPRSSRSEATLPVWRGGLKIF